MNDDRNRSQIIRVDARNCFVESLNDAFEIGKAHFTFASYDLSKPSGQRQTNSIQIYIDMAEVLELCRKLVGGELRYLMQVKKKNGDSTPLYQCLGGTSAEKLARYGRARADGKSLSRTAQLVCGSMQPHVFTEKSHGADTNSQYQQRKNVDAADQFCVVNYGFHHFTIPAFWKWRLKIRCPKRQPSRARATVIAQAPIMCHGLESILSCISKTS